MILRVTLDSNVYISASVFGGVPGRILKLLNDGRFEVASSNDIFDEVFGTLATKFGWSPVRISQARDHLSGLVIFYTI